MNLLFGFDPGGAGAFGWCVAEYTPAAPLRVRDTGYANNARKAVDAAQSLVRHGDTVVAAGIDAPMFWVADGDRAVDAAVRTRICRKGGRSGTVGHVSSLRGACLIQGIMAGMILRASHKDLPITESHPKAVLWLLGIAGAANPVRTISLSGLGQFSFQEAKQRSDHERDAALACLSAWAMASKSSEWEDLYHLESNAYSPLSVPIGYWVPKVSG